MADKKIPVLKTSKRRTEVVTAVFPYVHEQTKYGDYEVNVNMEAEPDLLEEIKTAARELWNKAAEEFGFDPESTPDNKLFKQGETKTGEAYFRVCFKMKGMRRVNGKEVPQKPRVVDSTNAPFTGAVYGGSKVRVAWFLQFTEVNGQRYISPKLEALKVIELVGPGGETDVNDLFGDDDEGFVAPSDAPPAGDPASAAPSSDSKPGGDF